MPRSLRILGTNATWFLINADILAPERIALSAMTSRPVAGMTPNSASARESRPLPCKPVTASISPLCSLKLTFSKPLPLRFSTSSATSSVAVLSRLEKSSSASWRPIISSVISFSSTSAKLPFATSLPSRST